MSIVLYIRGQRADTDAGSVIAQTLQINDIASIQGRNASYTNTFRLPKTANNARIMNFMSLAGNNASLQYEKNECSLYSAETGQCFIYKGWATITDGGEHYNVLVVSGIVDFYKAIENKTLSEIVVPEHVTHTKSIGAVTASWGGSFNKPYRYILADYNGDTGNTQDNVVNIDYLVPSVRVKYLWERLFEQFGFTFSGSVFDTQAFENLWMTFPKGLKTSESETLIFEATEFAYPFSTNGLHRRHYLKYQQAAVNTMAPATLNTHLRPGQAGSYRVEVSGSIDSRQLYGSLALLKSKLYLGKNSEGLVPHGVAELDFILDKIEPNQDFEASKVVNLGANDSICILVKQATGTSSNHGFSLFPGDTELTVKIFRQEQSSIDFGSALIDFPVKDFVNEIVNRFGLTIYPDNVTGSYSFLTLQEVLQGAEMADWSAKLVKKISENYIYGSYAARNWFRYNYNDKEESHNDWFLEVSNVNLPDSRDAFKSKIYSPESLYNSVSYLNRNSNVYKLWDKEPATDPETGEDLTKYKALDKRYYLMRAEDQWGQLSMQSKILEQQQPYYGPYLVESYWKLPFYDIMQDYYAPLRRVLDTSMIVTAELWLTASDICDFDFKKLYYFEQFSNYFLVNKINNFIPGKPAKVELVRVLYDVQPEVSAITITNVSVIGQTVSVYFDLTIPMPYVTMEYKRVTDSSWYTFGIPYTSNPWNYPLWPGQWEVRIKAGGQYSDTVQFTISN
ncbi:hypothetical protein [uncultured Flavobacterium sp.]|uniref:hypothetical protein n=1 Tax=uncultured Flavobacterium sp. TaxID=165435 RepID=UPI0025FBAEC5|nr:hypothetical protein [uncultured Flavobacterium sp.]